MNLLLALVAATALSGALLGAGGWLLELFDPECLHSEARR